MKLVVNILAYCNEELPQLRDLKAVCREQSLGPGQFLVSQHESSGHI